MVGIPRRPRPEQSAGLGMKARFNPAVFAIAFSVAYALAFWFNAPLFMFYPTNGDLVWGRTLLPDAGPAIVWYGLMSDAAIAGLVLALIVPDRAVAGLRNRIWLFPVAAMLASLYLLRIFFFR